MTANSGKCDRQHCSAVLAVMCASLVSHNQLNSIAVNFLNGLHRRNSSLFGALHVSSGLQRLTTNSTFHYHGHYNKYIGYLILWQVNRDRA